MKRQREVEHAQKWSIEGGEGKGVIDCDYVKDWMGKSWSGVGGSGSGKVTRRELKYEGRKKWEWENGDV